MTLDLMIQTLIKSFQIFDTIADTFVEVFITFRLFVPLTVYFKERLVVSLDHVDFEMVYRAALLAERKHVTSFVWISSVGADRNSKNFSTIITRNSNSKLII